MEGFIYLHRKMLDWEWYDDNNTKILFLHCLLKANWKPGSWHGIKYDQGQFITSLQTLAVETHLTVKQVRVALDHLKATNEVADQRQGNCRIITVNNWSSYQQKGKPSGKPKANLGQTKGKLGATDEEYKEREEGKEGKENNKYYPADELLNTAFADYVSMRKQMKKPMTEKAIELAKKKLSSLSGGNNDDAIAILNQSVMNSWQGLFPLNNKSVKQMTFNEKWSIET